MASKKKNKSNMDGLDDSDYLDDGDEEEEDQEEEESLDEDYLEGNEKKKSKAKEEYILHVEKLQEHVNMLRKAILVDRKYIKDLYERMKKTEDDVALWVKSK